MNSKDITDRLKLPEAEKLLGFNLAALTDDQVIRIYDAYACHISYLHADDYGGDWKLVPRFRPGLEKAKAELDRRSITPPTGYLL